MATQSKPKRQYNRKDAVQETPQKIEAKVTHVEFVPSSLQWNFFIQSGEAIMRIPTTSAGAEVVLRDLASKGVQPKIETLQDSVLYIL